MNNKKIFVGLSGGVDSSVTAALLIKQQAKVIGVYIKGWTIPEIACQQKEDRLDAMRVAAKLKIPLITLDLAREYKREVINYFLKEYSLGRTPNPDILCNSKIKFGLFYDYVKKHQGDLLATGHYAQIIKKKEEHFLVRGIDKKKDQSYFLWKLQERQLSSILFPLGKFKKEEIRKKAKEYNLPVAEKKDSQGICFMGQIDIQDFLADNLQLKTGLVMNLQKEVIGQHKGVAIYTIGQRHGFSIDKFKDKKHPPYYVVAKDMAKNILIVDNNPLQQAVKSFYLQEINWINKKPIDDKEYCGQIRHLGQVFIIKTKKTPKGYLITTRQPLLVAAGQSLVVYNKNICFGGGIISTF